MIQKKLCNYIKKLAHVDELNSNQDLFSSGLLTSLDVLDVILFIEREFSISFSDDDIGEDSFNSIDNMVKLIQSLDVAT
jgi:methoxymalonate biosynthesis acyl carrier protein